MSNCLFHSFQGKEELLQQLNNAMYEIVRLLVNSCVRCTTKENNSCTVDHVRKSTKSNTYFIQKIMIYRMYSTIQLNHINILMDAFKFHRYSTHKYSQLYLLDYSKNFLWFQICLLWSEQPKCWSGYLCRTLSHIWRAHEVLSLCCTYVSTRIIVVPSYSIAKNSGGYTFNEAVLWRWVSQCRA